MSNCIFCKIISGKIPSRTVYEDDICLAFLDIQPVSLGHTLLIPKKHFENFLETDDGVVQHLSVVLKKIARATMRATAAPACNSIVNNGAVAGQSVMHTHIHIILRFDGDGLHAWPKKDISNEDMGRIRGEIEKEMI